MLGLWEGQGSQARYVSRWPSTAKAAFRFAFRLHFKAETHIDKWCAWLASHFSVS